MPIIWDIIVVAIIVLFATTASRRGFLSTAAHLVGSVAALGVSLMYSRPLALSLYNSLIRDNLTGAMVQSLEAVGESSIEAFEAGVQAALSQLPAFLSRAVGPGASTMLDSWYESFVEGNAAGVGAMLADTVVGPVAVGLIQAVVFFVLFALCMIVVGLVSGLLRSVNRIPIIGSLNGFLGGVLGLVQGLLYLFVGAALIWLLISASGSGLPDFLSVDTIERTFLFKHFFFAGPWVGGTLSV